MQSLAKGKNHFILYISTNKTSISVAVKMEHNYYNKCTYMHITVTVTLAFIILLIFFSHLSQVALRFSHFFSLFSLLLFPSLFSFWLQPSPISRLRLGAPRHSLGSPSLRLRASPSSSPAPLASSEPSSPWP